MNQKATPLTWDDVTATYNMCLSTILSATSIHVSLMILYNGMSTVLKDKHVDAIHNFVKSAKEHIHFAQTELNKIYLCHEHLHGSTSDEDQNMQAITLTMQYHEWTEMAARTLIPLHSIKQELETPIRADMQAEVDAWKAANPDVKLPV